MQTTSTASSSSSLVIVIVIIAIVILAGIGYLVYKFAIAPILSPPVSANSPIPVTATNNTNSLNTTVVNAKSSCSSGSASASEGFQDSTPLGYTCAPLETIFLNSQAMSIKDTGYIGPYPKGVFNVETATGYALKAGFRFLTLQIDYMDTKKDLINYDPPGEPTLLLRDSTGAILSGNSGSIEKTITAIANKGFSPEVPNSLYPIIVYLHIVRAPSQVTDAKGYLAFLSKIAVALGPLGPYHLGLNPLGNFTRQQLANQILTMPLKSLKGQVIVMCNADTSLFRNKTLNENKYTTVNDLDFWVNMRVTLDDEADASGITQLADKSDTPAAVLVSLPRVLALSSLKQEAFAGKGKQRYVIAMGSRTDNPTTTEMHTALNTLGINAIPIDIFTPESNSILLIANEYSDMTYRPKPAALQYVS